jgi:hypothetical protein
MEISSADEFLAPVRIQPDKRVFSGEKKHRLLSGEFIIKLCIHATTWVRRELWGTTLASTRLAFSLGGQVALQLLGTVAELLHHVIVSRAWGVPEVL